MIRYPSVISLPNLRLYFQQDVLSQEYLLVSGGRAPDESWLRASAAGRMVCCVDHGADVCHAAKLSPLFFVGDGDSMKAETQSWLRSVGTEFRMFPTEKDETDTQLALAFLAERKASFIVLSGGFGGRFDHLFSLLYSFVGSGIYGCIADEREFLFVLRDGESVKVETDIIPKSVSLLPLSSQCAGVSLNGVHWPLSDALLRQENPYAVSNRMSSERRVAVTNGKGILGVYLCWNESGI